MSYIPAVCSVAGLFSFNILTLFHKLLTLSFLFLLCARLPSLPPIPTLSTLPSSAISSVDDEGVSAADVALMKSKVTIQYIKDFSFR